MRIIALIIGLLFGSFGSVLLVRLSEKTDRETIKSILRGRSKCPKCGAQLQARNLIPLVSFLLQRGKCEHCKQSISHLYPVLEIGSAVIFLVSFLAFQDMGIGTVVFRSLINRLFFLLIAYDVMKYELHVPLRTILLIVVAVPQFVGWQGNYARGLVSLLMMVVFFLAIFFLAKRYVGKKYGGDAEGFGQGDIYMGGVIALLMPFVITYNAMSFGRGITAQLLLMFVVLSCLLGILFRILISTIKKWQPNMFINTVSPLFQGKILIPFIPAMIIAFRILLRKADFFISLLFPLG